MEPDKKVETIQKAIRKLMEEEEINANTTSSHESLVALHEEEEEEEEEEDNEKAVGHRRRHNQRQLLSKLLSELESLEEDNNATDESKREANVEDTLSSEIDEKINTTKEVGNCSNEEIIKELKNVKRQNSITHYLLTAMIVVTLAWQLSEVSLILKIKDGLSNPVKSVGGIIKGFFKGRSDVNVQDVMKQVSEKQKQVIEPTYLPGLKIPELPHLDLPGFDTSDNDDD